MAEAGRLDAPADGQRRMVLAGCCPGVVGLLLLVPQSGGGRPLWGAVHGACVHVHGHGRVGFFGFETCALSPPCSLRACDQSEGGREERLLSEGGFVQLGPGGGSTRVGGTRQDFPLPLCSLLPLAGLAGKHTHLHVLCCTKVWWGAAAPT